MTSHFGLMVIFALFVSVVFATLMRDEPVSSSSSLAGSSPGSLVPAF